MILKKFLVFVKDMFCYSNRIFIVYWLKNWREIEKFFKECGYKELKEFINCFD